MPVHLERVINNKIDEAIAHVDRLITWVGENQDHAVAHDAKGVAYEDQVQRLKLEDIRRLLREAKR